MNVFILAAGFGERFTASIDARLAGLSDRGDADDLRRDLLRRRALPKGLQPIGGRVVLDFMMDQVRDLNTGVFPNHVYMITNGLYDEAFRRWAAQMGIKDSHIICNGAMTPEERGGSLNDLMALTSRFGIQWSAAILPTDSIFHPGFSLQRMVEEHPTENLMAVTPVERSRISRHGQAILDTKGVITSFIEKPADPPDLPEYLAAVALYVLKEPTLCRLYHYLQLPGVNTDAPGHFIQFLVNNGWASITGYRVPGRYDIGTLEGLEQAEQHILSERSS